jgi:hypothetical protein
VRTQSLGEPEYNSGDEGGALRWLVTSELSSLTGAADRLAAVLQNPVLANVEAVLDLRLEYPT